MTHKLYDRFAEYSPTFGPGFAPEYGLERYWEVGGTPTNFEILDNRIETLKKQIKELESQQRKTNLLFITINFKPDVPLDTIMLALSRLANRSMMKSYWYTIEQRGDREATRGTGLHSHWLVKTTKPMSEFRRDVWSTLKKYLGNDRHLDIRKYPIEFESDKLDYLRGLKWDLDKEQKVIQDRLFRAENNLESIYTNGT